METPYDFNINYNDFTTTAGQGRHTLYGQDDGGTVFRSEIPYRNQKEMANKLSQPHKKEKASKAPLNVKYKDLNYFNLNKINSAFNNNISFSTFKSRLPDNYGYAIKKNILCLNCQYFSSNNLCKLWKAPVKTNYTCNSHKLNESGNMTASGENGIKIKNTEGEN